MAIERTFSIIKPDATKRNLTGAINAIIEGAGLRIVAQRRIQMTKAQAQKFYEVHAERPFYGELVEQMTADYFKTEAGNSLLQRFSTPKELADQIVFLCSANASAINGAAQRVDGGVIRAML